MNVSFEDQLKILSSGAAQIFSQNDFSARLQLSIDEGRPLRVKLGLDPTAEHVHLGWSVVLRKLRQFQDLGHVAVLIVGDFTARVGDPSGRSDTRKMLERGQVEAYATSLLDQFSRVLSKENLEVRRNSEWLEQLGTAGLLQLCAGHTVARMLERDDFAKRYQQQHPISIVEFLYPLLQGYDSVAVRSDVELGGTDQTFNLLVGRDLQIKQGQRPQIALTMPLLEGLDGVQKMSQSLGNYIGVTEAPDDMFGKLMSLPDSLIVKYLRLTTDLHPQQVDEIQEGLSSNQLHPAEAKRRLAAEVVRMYHGREQSERARQRFDVVHKDRALPDDIQEVELPAEAIAGEMVWIPRLLVAVGLASSSSEARRLIAQGGVRVNGEQAAPTDESRKAEELRGSVLAVGRRRMVRLL